MQVFWNTGRYNQDLGNLLRVIVIDKVIKIPIKILDKYGNKD